MQSVLHAFKVGLALLATLAVGICVHELLHVVPLSLTDAEYAVHVLPSGDGSSLQTALTGGLVRVEVTHLPDATPEWLLRGSALAPLLLALPLALVAAGVLPNPLAADDHLRTAVLVALTGCGLPSPADWSVVWHGSDLAES
ncbi:hypothetical protein [Halorussus aquaticus]|uniref:Uncharacterized protein n=1 Tax=Halorussus aquaticus TaxID=2953748 RepID=A0ABD5PWH5_9EURY|nr:hypothetical protein [Halorussus aquaticus]